MDENPWYRIEIAPLLTMALSRSPLFSYASEVPIARGSLVHISFGRRQILGIVFESNLMKKISIPPWMKRVGKIDNAHSLTESQLSLAQFLAENTLTPLGICLKHFVPSRTQSKASKLGRMPKEKSIPLPLPSPAEKKIVASLSKGKGEIKLFHTAYSEGARNILLALLQKKISDREQVLFLVPELFLVEWWQQELRGYFPNDVLVTIQSQLKGSAMTSSWDAIRSGEAKIILGTRQALFAPFSKLQTILLADEEDQTSYKQWEMSPRYTVRQLVDELARLWKAQLILFTPTPSLGTQLSLSQKKLKRISGVEPIAQGTTRFVNMRFEKKSRGRWVLSQELVRAIERTLSDKRKVFLVAKQRGWSSFSICQHCRTVMRCGQCNKALTGDRDGGFSCLSCGSRTGLFPKCRSCQGMTFLSYGAGTDRVEREVRTHFPSARILRLDRNILKEKTLPEILIAMRNGNYDVLIGTHALVKVPNLPKTSLIAMIEADSALAFPDYQAEEKLVRDLERLRFLCGLGNGAQFLIQTFEPELSIFSHFLVQDYLENGKHFLTERLALGYPPYTRFIKIECRGRSLAESKKIAERIEQDITLLIAQEKLPILLISHHVPLSQTQKKRYQLFLRVLKLPLLPPSLKKLLIRYSKDCFYDIDPLTLT